MASLYVPSRVGIPVVAGALLYFYQTGTTTPVNTYSQSDLAIGHVNTNPVVADSNGLFGPIYLLPTPDYKVVWSTPTASLTITTDPLLTSSVSVITTQGDLIVGNNVGAQSRLPIGAAGDYLRSDGTTAAWHALALADATGVLPALQMPSGSIVQCVTASTNAYSSHTTALPYDNTIPQSIEGDSLLTANITPTTTSNRVRVTVLLNVDSGGNIAQCALFRGGAVNALAAAGMNTGADNLMQLSLMFEDVPGSVSAQAYALRVGPEAGTLYVNGISGGRKYGGVAISYMRVEEIVT